MNDVGHHGREARDETIAVAEECVARSVEEILFGAHGEYATVRVPLEHVWLIEILQRRRACAEVAALLFTIRLLRRVVARRVWIFPFVRFRGAAICERDDPRTREFVEAAL